ncbi:sin3 histone deacetylase corepressor complex component SDS3 isoform X2 [Condylostylus longicornis]|uniref:sin3 histone deacetylase corepressor complex component SDS3 isoform X2 n=1 Tax=Condylostylus longicornis TaxID=2530218 RepID=UPI00244DD0C9|nr:sin3 histone deacetylase corepressor complex component SDS3 isoform X2 [Condylostylus longicornis]
MVAMHYSNSEISYSSYPTPQYYDGDEDRMSETRSSEDTEEASENEFGSSRNYDEPMEIKEQMYQDKLASLKKQLEELQNGTHPEYVKRVKKLEHQYKERLRLNEIYRDYLKECVDRDYYIEKKAATKEYEEKKIDLKENLLTDFEDKRRIIESERHSLELTSDSMETKPTITRKLRRRGNEPVPIVEKRRKPTTGQLLVYQLDEKEIDSDLKQISRALTTNGIGANNHQSGMMVEIPQQTLETRIEDGKLLYERRWFHRGQPVYVEGKDLPRFAATISAIGNEIVWVKKINDNNKVKINMSQLAKAKVTIKRRAN